MIQVSVFCFVLFVYLGFFGGGGWNYDSVSLLLDQQLEAD